MTSATKMICLLIPALLFAIIAAAQSPYVATTLSAGAFALSAAGATAPLYADEADYPGVRRAAINLQADLGKVTGHTPALHTTGRPTAKTMVIVGTIGKSKPIDDLVKRGKLNVQNVSGKRETFVIQTIDKPLRGVDRALVIAGSDKRGTIFGIYDLCEQIGVSPWYWWADVPPRKSSSLYVLPGRYVQGEPGVQYRGIFLNDEEPALGRWAVENYGGFNHVFYERVFELILRMKGNYLWPAMWWASFNSDDTLNPKLADEYGIVMGTTHHEPMMRAHAEWKKTGTGAWNYETNDTTLRAFWTDGIRRMGSRESIVSLGMRGDGDMAMSEQTNIALLERIVKDQRAILREVTKKNEAETPQLWALYKEVQDYYDKGMRVPDDVTLLLCDDNWGNIRKLPRPDDPPRKGGYGIYYHFDYVGGPRNYKWLNTNQIERTWEQMHLAYRHGATKIWIVNVGDLKPMEFPTEFFLDYAWDPARWNESNLAAYTRQWCAQQFGSEHAASIAGLLDSYTRFNARRKPELLSPDTYSLVNYREAETIVHDFNTLVRDAEKIYHVLPVAVRDAYYQLVLHPVKASANLNELYVTVANNRLYASQQRAATNDLAAQARTLFEKDAALSRYYNHTLAGGKWNHMMDQTHISYTTWQQPEKDVLPDVKEIVIPSAPKMGVAIEGSDQFWPAANNDPVLPVFDAYRRPAYSIDIYNRGSTPFSYTLTPDAPFITVDEPGGMVEKQKRATIAIDWSTVPPGTHRIPLHVRGSEGSTVTVYAVISNPASPPRDSVKGFIETGGVVSIEAQHYHRAIAANGISWSVVPNLGRTLSAVTTFPVTAGPDNPGAHSARLEYVVHLFDSGEVDVKTYCSPTLNLHNRAGGLRYGISFDDEPVQIVSLHNGAAASWSTWVSDNIIIKTSRHTLARSGKHTLKFWRVDAGVVLQKIVVDAGGERPSYLGPPESYRR